MKSIRVLDTDFDSVRDERYDVAFFASGYESRCVYIPGMIEPGSVEVPLVLGFTEGSHSGQRDRNDLFYADRWKQKAIPLSGDDEKLIYERLRTRAQTLDRPIQILVDYSSMSRLWYTAVLNWARFAAPPGKSVIMDFVYSVGEYDLKGQEPARLIRGMVSLPGCEGRAYHQRESVAVFGLGFHGMAALCVLDQLEADTVYAFLASPGSSEDYNVRCRDANMDLINSHKTKAVLELPLFSVESSYRHIAEMIAPHRPDGEITLVPMGPKPHVLASILVAMRFQEVACLRVTFALNSADVKPVGEIVATRVIVGGGPDSKTS